MESIPSHMKGLVIESFARNPKEESQPYKFKEDLQVPNVEPHQILIKVKSSGYCHTEMMVARDEFDEMSKQGLPDSIA